MRYAPKIGAEIEGISGIVIATEDRVEDNEFAVLFVSFHNGTNYTSNKTYTVRIMEGIGEDDDWKELYSQQFPNFISAVTGMSQPRAYADRNNKNPMPWWAGFIDCARWIEEDE